MSKLSLSTAQLAELEIIFTQLQEEYERVAAAIHFTCDGCPDNCCDSYFLHHTYVEWAYLWAGFSLLPQARQEQILVRCADYQRAVAAAEDKGERPQAMCPLNDQGRCSLYQYRMLVCRTHGVPAQMIRPDGQSMKFPGCFRCQEEVAAKFAHRTVPLVDRTPWLRRLALLENQLLHNRRHLAPRVRMTIAEMLLKGAPSLTGCSFTGDEGR